MVGQFIGFLWFLQNANAMIGRVPIKSLLFQLVAVDNQF